MQHAIALPAAGPARWFTDLARAAEESGWDGLFLDDHIQFPPSMGLRPLDPWVLLGAVAGHTRRLRIGTMVAALARRRPQKVAKELVTLDHLTEGRVTMGVGLGNLPRAEFAAFGDDPEPRTRAARTDEALEIVSRLCEGEPVHHRGTHFTVSARFEPLPVQRPRPPVWIACGWPNRRPLERARRWDGVVAIDKQRGYLDPAEVAEVVAALGPVAPGFDVVAMRAPDRPAAEYEAAGTTWLIETRPPVDDWRGELEAAAHRAPR